MQKEYKKDVRIVAKHFVVHPQVATIPALATCAAQQQGKFAEMEKLIWEKGWTNERPDNLSQNAMNSFAQELKLDKKKFATDIESEKCKKQVEDGRALMMKLGARGTPTFYINGRVYTGPPTAEGFKKVIDEEIGKADQALENGVKLDDYYASIVERGKKSL